METCPYTHIEWAYAHTPHCARLTLQTQMHIHKYVHVYNVNGKELRSRALAIDDEK